MKSIIISLLCFLTITVAAQTEKGKFLTGGNLSFYSSKINDSYNQPRDYYYDILPKLGYFVHHNLAIGAGLNLRFSNRRSLVADDYHFDGYTSTAYGLSPFMRYYIDLDTRFKFYGELTLSGKYGTTKYQDQYGKTGEKLSSFKSFGTNIAPGLAFLPSKRWSFDLSVSLIGYETTRIKYTSGFPEHADVNNLTLGFDTFKPSIGVNYHF